MLTTFGSTSFTGVEIATTAGVKRHFILVFALTFCTLPLQCATLERLTLDDMIVKSTAIVRGKVANSYSAFSGRVIYTHYSVQVVETLKGAASASVDVAVPGGVANHLRQTFSGAPEFRPGDEFVFFLWTGKSGLTQVIGLSQGLFSLGAGASGDPVVTRAASGELMLAPGTGKPVTDRTMAMRLSELKTRIAAVLGPTGSAAK
jgi:hypothetical protein